MQQQYQVLLISLFIAIYLAYTFWLSAWHADQPAMPLAAQHIRRPKKDQPLRLVCDGFLVTIRLRQDAVEVIRNGYFASKYANHKSFRKRFLRLEPYGYSERWSSWTSLKLHLNQTCDVCNEQL